jgi:hypothetical protein
LQLLVHSPDVGQLLKPPQLAVHCATQVKLAPQPKVLLQPVWQLPTHWLLPAHA